METKSTESIAMIELLRDEPSVEQSPNKRAISTLFNEHPEIKKKYAGKVRAILKEVYHKNYKTKKDLPEGDFPGIYDLETEGRSVINKFDTNYSALAILIDEINIVLLSVDKFPINLKNKSGEELTKECDNLFSIMEKYKHKIFSWDSKIFQRMIKMVSETHILGEKREDIVINKLKWAFGKNNVTKIGCLGNQDDMFKGVDVIVERDEKKYTGQIKPFGKTQKSGDNLIMHLTGNVKPYNVDWMIFENRKDGILIFDNKDIRISGGKYIIPSKNLVIKLINNAA